MRRGHELPPFQLLGAAYTLPHWRQEPEGGMIKKQGGGNDQDTSGQGPAR
jgi:hypothetical protein